MGVREAFYEECEYFHEPVRPAKVELPDKQDDKWPECPKQFRIHTCNDSSRFCIYALIHEKFTLASSLGPADQDKFRWYSKTNDVTFENFDQLKERAKTTAEIECD